MVQWYHGRSQDTLWAQSKGAELSSVGLASLPTVDRLCVGEKGSDIQSEPFSRLCECRAPLSVPFGDGRGAGGCRGGSSAARRPLT